MPIFRSTLNILKIVDDDEVFDENWMDSDFLMLPEYKEWDYKKELQIEDVDTWEVLFEGPDGLGIYAAWNPYAEFYMVTEGSSPAELKIETYYGKGAQHLIQKKIKELKIPYALKKIWVDDDKMWLFSDENNEIKNKKIILPY